MYQHSPCLYCESLPRALGGPSGSDDKQAFCIMQAKLNQLEPLAHFGSKKSHFSNSSTSRVHSPVVHVHVYVIEEYVELILNIDATFDPRNRRVSSRSDALLWVLLPSSCLSSDTRSSNPDRWPMSIKTRLPIIMPF